MVTTNWTQSAGMAGDTDTDNIVTYAEQASASKDAAAVSAANAATYKDAAASSATNAATSASAASTSASQAASSASAASTSKTAAELAETNAETAETNAAASATAAASSASAAAASEAGVDADRVAAQAAASAAATSETNAATSETNAATSETSAATSATNASSSQAAAYNSAVTAIGADVDAATSATNAASSASGASSSATSAATSATNAATSETNAAASATASAYSAASIVGDVADAQSAATQALGYRDTASLHKLAAEAAATSATNTAAALTGFDLDAIAATKAVTAVDVFVYDTSKDSDGGAWRKRTQGTSWYNEALNTATRGSRKEFPAVAVIVAESGKVTIYDGDDPALPMWMVFNGSSSGHMIRSAVAHSVAMLNGELVTGSSSGTEGVQCINFLRDGATVLYSGAGGLYLGNISARGGNKAWSYGSIGFGIVSGTVNDVAMTVLPNAPIDPATGLPVPTIAVGCGTTGQPNGGTSIIKHDGTVVDIVASTGAGGYACFDLGFGPNGQLVTTQSYNQSYGYVHIFDKLPDADIPASPTPSGARTYSYLIGYPSIRGSVLGYPKINGMESHGDVVSFALSDKLSRLIDDGATKANSMVAYTTSSYNTGWMNGDIKGAFLSDTSTTALVGSELVTNGTFDTDVSGWTDASEGTGSISWDASGALALNNPATSSSEEGIAYQTITTIVGQPYTLTVSKSGAGSITQVGTGVGGSTLYQSPNNNTSVFTTFIPTTTTTYITLRNFNTPTPALVDNISVKLADADRSVNNKGLIVNGTVTKTPVATGADLVGYDCSAGYLTRDFAAEFSGSDTFVWMGWHYGDPDKTGGYFAWYETVGGGTSSFYLNGYIDATSGAYRLVWQGRASLLPNTTPSIAGRWAFIALVFSGNTVKYYLDGVLVHTASGVPASDLHELRINPSGGNKKALLRISATAPTASQIAKIYNDEKVLFQENAQATLYGTSDAVTALAHDDTTDLLHVGTSSGRSVFQGLRRVSNTTTAVGTAISASNGMVVEE